jgi:hypothetical protein
MGINPRFGEWGERSWIIVSMARGPTEESELPTGVPAVQPEACSQTGYLPVTARPSSGKSAAAVLTKYGQLEDIPSDPLEWGLTAGRARRLAENLEAHREEVFLYRELTRLRLDVPLDEGLQDLGWRGASHSFETFCSELGAAGLVDQAPRWGA